MTQTNDGNNPREDETSRGRRFGFPKLRLPGRLAWVPKVAKVPDLPKLPGAPGLPSTPDSADVQAAARIAGTSVSNVLGWALKGSVDAAAGLVRDFGSGEPVLDAVDSQVEHVRAAAWRGLGITETGEGGIPEALAPHSSSYRDLRTQGDRLIDSAWDPRNQPRGQHPAYAQILQELVADEALILRFLRVAEAQPAIDVRTKTMFGIGSERVVGGINMVASMAGCTWPDRGEEYLANLNRLGLLRFSKEPVDDYRRYALIEVQPEAMDAIESVRKARTVYRSIHLSLFGERFCDVCFTTEGYDAGGWDDADVRGDVVRGRKKKKSAKKHGH